MCTFSRAGVPLDAYSRLSRRGHGPGDLLRNREHGIEREFYDHHLLQRYSTHCSPDKYGVAVGWRLGLRMNAFADVSGDPTEMVGGEEVGGKGGCSS